MNAHEQVEKALSMAKENNIKVTEVWFPEREYSELASELKEEGEFKTYQGLRVRRSDEEFVRVGETTCPFGPGKT